MNFALETKDPHPHPFKDFKGPRRFVMTQLAGIESIGQVIF